MNVVPGMRDRNLRQGDLHEELGIFLLKAIALVAPVPRPEDVGHDAFATLIRLEGSRRLIPDLSFLVQLKSASVTSVNYESPDGMAWIRELEVPFFVGRVDLTRTSIELFATHGLQQILLQSDYYDSLELLLDEPDKPSTVPRLGRAYLGPPIHTWSTSNMTDPEFITKSHLVLRPHIETLQRNHCAPPDSDHEAADMENRRAAF